MELPDDDELEPPLEELELEEPLLDVLEPDELPPEELLEEDDVCTPLDTAMTVFPSARVTDAPPTSWCGLTVSSSVRIPWAVSPFNTAAVPAQLE